MSTPWAQATERLSSLLTVARLDPWTSALVLELASTGVFDGQFRRGRGHDLLAASRTAYDAYIEQHRGSEAMRGAHQTLLHVTSEVRAFTALGDDQRAAVLDWAGTILLERIDDSLRSVTTGTIRVVVPGLAVGSVETTCAGVISWWAARSVTDS